MDMNKFGYIIAVCLVTFLMDNVPRCEAETNEVLSLIFDLSDGSHIIGTPAFSSVSIQTAYAKMEIPLKQIQNIKISDDHEMALLDLVNGDRLKGALILGKLELQTLFGKVSLRLEHVKNISVCRVSSGALPIALKNSLILHYSFDKDEGNKVTDNSSKGHDGRVYGAKWVPKGTRGGACEFNGHGDYIDAGNTADFDFDASKDWTFAFWVYPRGSLSQMCFYNRTGADHINNGGENYLWYQTEASPTGISWGPINEEWDTGVPLLLDQWQQVVVLYSASARRACLYVNGAERASVPAHSVGRSSGPLRIGDNANCNFFKGMIDEVMIFNRALAGNEVKGLYDSQK